MKKYFKLSALLFFVLVIGGVVAKPTPVSAMCAPNANSNVVISNFTVSNATLPATTASFSLTSSTGCDNGFFPAADYVISIVGYSGTVGNGSTISCDQYTNGCTTNNSKTITGNIDISKLSAGTYTAQVVATNQENNNTATKTATFTISPSTTDYLNISSLSPNPADTSMAVAGTGAGGISYSSPCGNAYYNKLSTPTTYAIDGGSATAFSLTTTSIGDTAPVCPNTAAGNQWNYSFNFAIDTSALTSGTHSLVISAYDKALSKIITVTGTFTVTHATGTIVVTSSNSVTGDPVSANWDVVAAGVDLQGNGVTSQTYTNQPAGISYTIVPVTSPSPSGYALNSIRLVPSRIHDDPILAFIKNIFASSALAWNVPNGTAQTLTASATATFNLQWDPVAACGTANGVQYPYGSSSYSPNTQCSTGTSSNTSFPTAGNSVSWTCTSGLSTASCSASQSAQCPSGQAYSNGSCVVCTGGCTGPGGPPNTGLTCNNGASNPPACTYASPTATLSANPSTINQGNSTMLYWGSTNATSCAGTGFSTGGATSGSVSTGTLNNAGAQNYQVTCSGAVGTSSPAFATVTVLPPTATISASPTRVQSGGTSKITWSASNVSSCQVTNSSGNKLASGNADHSNNFSSGSPYTATVTTQSTFTISCNLLGNGNTKITNSATVNIVPLFQEF